MVLYIGDRIDEQFVSEIAKNIAEELRMITDAHTMQQAITTIKRIPNRLVIINVISIQEYPDEIVKQLKYIQSNLQNNLIIIARGQDSSDPFIQSLYFAGIKNIILSTWIPTVVSQCLKYITGMYEETNLLYFKQETTASASNQEDAALNNETTKLNLSEVFQNDPDILIQLSEEQQAQGEEKNLADEANVDQNPEQGTVKLSNEELYMSGADLYAQVKEYENISDQSTILYNQPMKDERQPSMPQNVQQMEYEQLESKNTFPQYQNNNDTKPVYCNEPKYKKIKKSKKSTVITLCLCGILAVSIMVPIGFTMMQKSVQKKKSQEYLAEITKEPTSVSSKDVPPTNTPQLEIVIGAIEEGQADEVQAATPTPLVTEAPSITLTPIKDEVDNKAPEKTLSPTTKPIKTLNPTVEPTIKPIKTPKPTIKPMIKPIKTPKPTIKPTIKPIKTPKPTIKPTVAPIKIKRLVLPQSIRMIKGTRTEIETSYSPSNATESISWSSSDNGIATVKKGVITAKKAGTVTITAKTSGGIKKTIRVVIGNE